MITHKVLMQKIVLNILQLLPLKGIDTLSGESTLYFFSLHVF